MSKLVIIADDFTGALDTGVQFSRNSISTIIVLYRDLDFSTIDKNVEVVVIDTESRHVSIEEAAIRVKEVAVKALEFGATYFYKKTDSVLRGNIGSELLAVMDATGSGELMFVPAYPDAKRATISGCQFLNGIPIDETEFARDPIDPISICYIPHIIQLQSDVEVSVVSKDEMQKVCSNGISNKIIFVFNAEKNNDMIEIAGCLKINNKLRLTAGCAGFAKELLDVLDLEKSKRHKKSRIKGKMLTICGSINKISLKQVKYAENNKFQSITLNTNHKLVHGFFKTLEGQEWIYSIVKMLEEGNDVIIKTVDNINDEEKCREKAQEMQLDEDRIPFIISHNIGNLVSEIVAKTNLNTLVVFGGDTAEEVVNSLGFIGVLPRDEIMTGVVLSDTLGTEIIENFITKSGGFGEKNVLVKIKEHMLSL